MRYCTEFFVSENQLWRKDPRGPKTVIFRERQLFLISITHNDVGHHGFFATNALITERYWWPHMSQDIAWFILTCHMCQIRKTQHVVIPPMVAMPDSTTLLESLHGHNAYAYIFQLQIHHTRLMLAYLLA